MRINLIICKHFQQIIAFIGAFRIAKLFTQNASKPGGKQNNVNPCNFYFLLNKRKLISI
jgi:hypothetical protein